jgi:2-polyprenyl-3-methyl-5-hydroxy-6-metoxy-1,4-benzoquinol methylase
MFNFALTYDQYQELFNPDREGGYPGNHVAYRHILNVLHDRKASRLLEVGVGNGLAIPIFSGAGMDFIGIDNKPEMVAKSKMVMLKCGLSENDVIWGDIEDSISLSPIRNSGGFDGLVAMGVLPHVSHELAVLRNMWHLVKPGGTIFVECRNKLFSLITFNRFTYEFILDDLLFGVDPAVRNATAEFLKSRIDTDLPPIPTGHPTKQHNPLEIERIFVEAGFENVSIIPFHFHAATPRLENQLGASFRSESMKLENEPSGWRGLFLCSAFIVEAQRPER